MTVGSLFSGIGGLDLALEAHGHRVIWQAECDPYARAVLAKHWPGVRCYNDVREIDEHAERPDIICGGFPCQDISNAGKRAGIDGARSGLWSEFARIVRALRPRYVFVENVAALLGRGLDRVLGDLAAVGYDAEWHVFRASDVGASHRRERIFILADAAELQQGQVIEQRARVDAAGYSRPRNVSLGNAERIGRGARWGKAKDGHDDAGHRFPPGPQAIDGWAGPEPAIRRGAHGIPRRVDRLRCLGNAVVPAQAALAWERLIERAA